MQRDQPSQGLRDWISTMWGACAAPGCTRPRHATQDNHNVPYDAGGATAEENLLPYCEAHHQWKTERACRVEIPGIDDREVRRWWVTPTGHRYAINHPLLLPDDGDDRDDSSEIPDPPTVAPNKVDVRPSDQDVIENGPPPF